MDAASRKLFMDRFGKAVDGVVRQQYSDEGLDQEPDITSRIAQRVEDALNDTNVGRYRLQVTTHVMPDRSARSLERPTGADMILSVSTDGPDGFNKSLFIQAKYDFNLNKTELRDACDRMRRIVGKVGSYVWVYQPDGLRVISADQVDKMRGNSPANLHKLSAAGMAGRIVDCYAGSRRWGIAQRGQLNRKQVIIGRLRELRAQVALDVLMKQD
jgi:hypothetical protein